MRSAVVVCLLASACAGELAPVGDDDPGETPQDLAIAAFAADVQPLLDGFCRGCHGGTDALGFIRAAPDVHTTVMAWPGLVTLNTPSASRLLTKGTHDGPAWTPAQKTTIRGWIDLEVVARTDGGEVIETPIIDPVPGANRIALDSVGLAGARVEFMVEELSLGLYLSEISLVAGDAGAHINHPLFVTWDGEVPRPDPVDSFEQLDLGVGAGERGQVGGGLLILADVAPTARLSLHFRTAEPYAGDTEPGPVGGCQAIAPFTASARPPLTASCASCHAGGMAGATNATDMRLLADLSPTGQAGACGQILSRVNLTTPATSGLFVAVDPAAGSNHPFRFANANAFNTFRTAVTTWIQAEIAASQP